MILLEFVLDIFDHDPYHSNDGNDEGSKCEGAKMVSTNSEKHIVVDHWKCWSKQNLEINKFNLIQY